MKEFNKSLKYIIRGGVATSAMDTLAIGPTIVAYAMCFGAGNISLGILSSIPYFGNLMHLLAAYLIEKGFSIKKISIYSSFASRPFYLLAALLSFFPNSSYSLFLLILFLSVAYLIGSLSGGAWMPWMKKLIPQKIMGHFFSERFKYMMIVKIICLLASSYFLREVSTYYPEFLIYAYAILLILAFIIGIYGSWTFIGVEDKKVKIKKRIPFHIKMIIAIRNKLFIRLLFINALLTFSMSFLPPFIIVFTFKRLGYTTDVVLLLSILNYISYAGIIKYFGRIADQNGVHSVLTVSAILFIIVSLLLIILNIFNFYGFYLISLINIILGAGTAGLSLGINNLSLIYIPSKNSSIYLSINSFIKSLFGVIGGILAGFVLSFSIFIEKIVIGYSNISSGWTLFFVFSFFCLIGLLKTIIQFFYTSRLNINTWL